MTVPSDILVALKQSNPALSDEAANRLWDEIVTKVPKAAEMPAGQIAQAMMQSASSPLKSPYAGTAMEARNPQNPQAGHMDQFDPEAMKAAYADYANRYAQTAGQRALGQGLAAAAGPAALQAVTPGWEALDKENMLRSIGQQKALQEQATSGIAAGTNLQNQFQQAKTTDQGTAKFMEDLAQAQQKTATGALDLKHKEALFKPGTSAAKLAAVQLRRQFEASGQQMPRDIDPDKMSVEDMKQFMEPKLLASWEAISRGRTAEAGADIDEAVSGAMVNKPAKGAAPSGAKFDFKPDTNLAAMRQVLSTSKDVSPEDLAAFDRQFPEVAGQTPSKPTLTAEGQQRTQFATIPGGRVSLPPDPRVVAGAAAEGEDAAAASRRARVYDTQVAPALQNLRKKIAETGSGKGTAFLAAWTPGESRELLNLLQNANNVYPGMLPKEIAGEVSKSIAQGGFTGALVASLDNGQLTRVIDSMEQTAARDREYQRKINAGQPTAARPGQQEVAVPVASSKPVRMKNKAGRIINVPPDKVKEAEFDGFERQ